jgi:hypothetical protein
MRSYAIYVNFLLLYLIERTPAQAVNIVLYADVMYVKGGHIEQEVSYLLSGDIRASLKLECFRYVPGQDSILIGRTHLNGKKLKKGVGTVRLRFKSSESVSGVYLNPTFIEIVKRAEIIPPGHYKVFVTLTSDSVASGGIFLHEIDSILPVNTPLRKQINDHLLAESKKGEAKGKGRRSGRYADNASVAFRRSQKRMEREFRRKGIYSVRRSLNGKEIAELYYQAWFLGRYQIDSSASVSSVIQEEQNSLKVSPASLTGNEFGSYRSLFSQFRELKRGQRENEEMEGEFSWGTFLSNDQEEGSQIDNNYHEVRGAIEVPVMDLPVLFEGFYTTQDRERQAKAGYLRVHYDARKSKERLLKLVNSYKGCYTQTDAQAGGYKMIYGQYLQQARAKQAEYINQLQKETGLSGTDFRLADTAVLRKKAEERVAASNKSTADTSATARSQNGKADRQHSRQQAEEQYKRWQDRYNQVQDLDAKIARYQRLLDQYDETLKWDSLLAYDKLKSLEGVEQMSYKDLAKKSSHILPEGKASSSLAGITSIDLGMFPKYVSSYTMAGQRVTGADVGYDVGVAEVGATYGKAEYVNRDGTMEDYATYSGRIRFKPIIKQQVGLVYYGYSPGRRLMNEGGFFKDTDVSLPSFREPVHIVSASYSSGLSKYALLNAEYAISRRQGQRLDEPGALAGGQSAYNIGIMGTVPRTSIGYEGAYEHTGRAFENNTLPVVMTGTSRYRGAVKGDFFRSFLTVGVEYNYLLQQSLSYRGGNSKWGFSVQTRSRRYPTVYLSYKPFATFRSYDDTLSIEQRPMFGSVWTSRLNYQIKRQHHTWMFVLLYNRNVSLTDTVRYGSSLLQFTVSYSTGVQHTILGIGSSRIESNVSLDDANPFFNPSRFVNIMTGREMGGGKSLSGGGEVAFGDLGLSRYSLFTSANWRLPKLPFSLRATFRYTNYRATDSQGWKQLYAGGLELVWQFRKQLKGT